jgi:hypothetical protein
MILYLIPFPDIKHRPRKQERLEVLSNNEHVFSDADESALSIIPSDWSARTSIVDKRSSTVSDAGDALDVPLSFENALFTSHVYKRTYGFLLRSISIRGKSLRKRSMNLATGPDVNDKGLEKTTAYMDFGADEQDDSPLRHLTLLLILFRRSLHLESSFVIQCSVCISCTLSFCLHLPIASRYS